MRYLIFFFLIFSAFPLWSLTAKQYYQAALEEKDLKNQIELFTKAINKAPKYISAYHRRGDAYRAQGKIKKALADYSKIIELSPKDPFKYYARGLAYLDIKDYAAAKHDFTEAIKLKNNYSGFYYNRALCLIELGHLKSALADLKKIKDDSLKDKALFLEGRANYKLYNYEKAENIFDELYKQNPEEEVVLYLARIQINKEMYDEAISLLSKVINKNPNNETAFILRAAALKEISLYPQALEDYTSLIALNPQAIYYNRRGLIYEEFADWANAKKDYSSALLLNPNLAVSYNNRGYVNMKMGKYDEAKKDFELALKSSSVLPTAAINYAGYYWTVKRDKRNMYKYLDKALKTNFKDISSLYDDNKKGWLFKKINNTLDFRTFVESR